MRKIKALISTIIALAGVISFQSARAFPLSVNADEPLNNLTVVDNKQKNMAYLKVDPHLVVPIGGINTRTIVAFNIENYENIESINRLTLQVKYKKGIWPFKKTYTETDTISSTDIITLKGNIGVNSLSKMIFRMGFVSDVFENTDYGRFLKGSSEQQNKFKTMAFYAVMKWDRTYEEVFISIDANLKDGSHVSDGTNQGGFYLDENEIKYFDFDLSSPYAYFSKATSIKYIQAKSINHAPDKVGGVNIYFAQYDYETNKIKNISQQYFFSDATKIELNFDVQEFTIAYISSYNGSSGFIRIGYEAQEPVVSYNFRDSEGNLPAPTPEPVEDPWWKAILKWFKKENADFFNALKVLGVAIGVMLLIFAIEYIIRWFNRGKKVVRTLSGKNKD